MSNDEIAAGQYGEGAYAKQDNRFKAQEPVVDVQAVVELAASFGPVAINRAYCNWQFFGRYRDALLQNAVELIQLFPPGASAKNGADIKLCLDAAEDINRFGHIGTVVVVGGDSDFMPVAQKIKAAGRTLVGIGSGAGAAGAGRLTGKNRVSRCGAWTCCPVAATARIPQGLCPACRNEPEPHETRANANGDTAPIIPSEIQALAALAA